MTDYINRKLLLKKFCEKCNEAMSDEPCEPADCFAMEIIKSQPTADVAEVRHGHWIDCEDEYSSYVRCSVCGDEYTNWEADCAHTDFCPGCGADMRGDNNEICTGKS